MWGTGMPYKPGTRPTSPLGECGHPTWRDSKVCRSCYLAARKRETQSCACGAPLSTPRATQCRACWMKAHMAKTSRPACQRCGKLISWQVGHKANPAKLCMPCYGLQRLENRIIVQQRRATATIHDSKKARFGRSMAGPLRELFGPRPCAACGYNRIPCHIHRIVAENGYVLGNVVQVCPNCHGEIHRGLIEPPAPSVP